jgi:hypothetical protein
MRNSVWRAVITVALIIFLFYSSLLMREFERSGLGSKQGLSWAIANIFTTVNFAFATIGALIGYMLIELLRKRF